MRASSVSAVMCVLGLLLTTAITTRTAARTKLNQDRLVVDKPFIFALRDKISGLVLVSGYVGSITAEATQ
ncbi:hypothetical protein [Bradyrhizobium sp. LHD-71]|uniref:hypothetical protein n=1 Tax=Bradyrhizobium sp. LHD-71 TaxID=3072141 RepID=UPI00280D85A9|nr:hypothetical protein [Bradyrhizobium sp. LHD-71]MDQ8732719.1 hypothetical protein [Bradyrhizobium sp. LHD-71]